MRRLWVLSGLVGLSGLAVAAPPPPTSFRVTVAAGPHDRRQVPVRVPVEVPAVWHLVTAATVVGPEGQALVGQLVSPSLLAPARAAAKGYVARELWFVVPALAAGASAAYTVTVPGKAPRGPAFRWRQQPADYWELRYGDRPVLRYQDAPYDPSSPAARNRTFKVFHHLFDPTGQVLVTKGPGGLYTHHRGLLYGFMKVTYGTGHVVDIWHCKGDTHQQAGGVLDVAEGPVLGRQRVLVEWRGDGQELFAKEEREVTVYQTPGGTLLDFASRLRSVHGVVRVDGDPQHAGFHFRAAQDDPKETDEKKINAAEQTYFLRPDGQGKIGQTRNWPGQKTHVNLPWDAMSFQLGAQRYTVAYLDRPGNPKEARFSERAYGRFGSYFVAECDEQKPLDVAYRIWLQAGDMQGDAVQRLDTDFVEPPVVAVEGGPSS